jgi:histone acetyltransferase 1
VQWEQETRRKYKIAQRQFDRLLEMLLLKQLDRKDAAKVKAYRLHVKARLYRFNYVSIRLVRWSGRADE